MRFNRASHAWSDALAGTLGWGPALMVPALAIAVALAAAAPSFTSHRQSGPDGLSGRQLERIMAEANPAAVLAWAKANCDSGLQLASDAPRTQMEIILQVAAAYDAESRRRSVADVCADALGATSSITARGTAPTVTGGRF